jgi:hypothetical protein
MVYFLWKFLDDVNSDVILELFEDLTNYYRSLFGGFYGISIVF